LASTLQILSDDKGLNITYGTLSAALKYVSASHLVDKARQLIQRFALHPEALKVYKELLRAWSRFSR
jgi:dGTP triphosphohydrolase